MSLFRGLDSSPNSEVSSIASVDAPLYTARLALSRVAAAAKNKAVTKLGLSQSAKIALDIVKVAQRAHLRRTGCICVAEEAYQLVNAVYGGVSGRAIDVNNVLKDYVARLNGDLDEIKNILKGFGSFWTFFRFRSTARDLARCHDILSHGMDMYLLLLKCSLAQPERRETLRQAYETIVERSSLDHYRDRHATNVASSWSPPPPKPTRKPAPAPHPPRQARSSGSVAF